MKVSSRILSLALAVLAIAGCGDSAQAQGNPLNLPEPRDPNKPGVVLMYGGSPLTDEVFEKFIELAGGPKARIVLIPSGTYVRGRRGGREFNESPRAFESRMESMFSDWVDLKSEGRIASFRFLATDNQEDADDPEFVAPLETATGVWIPAAYQGKLNWRFASDYPEKTSLFQKGLREVVARGGVVGGAGGGMAALPEIMIMGDSGQDDGPAEAVVRFGLTLFNGAIVDQLFDARGGRLERFTGLLKDTAALDQRLSWPATGRNMIGLAVEPRTAVLLKGNTVTTIGEKRAHLFTKSNGDRTITWRVVRPADGTIGLVSSSEWADRPANAARPAAAVRPCKNPFGIPSPAAGTRAGTVVLHGGGGNRDFIPVFIVMSGKMQPRLVHCPAASDYFRPSAGESSAALNERIEARFREWTRMTPDGRIADVRFLTTDRPADADDPDFVRPLRQADAVWFSGGDQEELARLFIREDRPTRFHAEVLDVLRRGGIVGGTSAGAAVMSEIMIAADVRRDGQPVDAHVGRGLGLLRNVVAEQHFQGAGRGGRIERFTRLLLDNERLRRFAGRDGPKPEEMIGIAVEERTALVLRENRVRVFGCGRSHLFLKSADQKTITWHALQSGDAAFLHQGPEGPVLELDEWRIR